MRSWWRRLLHGESSELLDRIRLIFMILSFANVAATFFVALAGGAAPHVRALSCAAALAVGVSNWWVLRRQRSGLGVELLTAGAMFGSSLALPDATMTVSLSFSSLMFRALYGKDRDAAMRLALYLGAYATALLLAGSQGRLTTGTVAAILQPTPAIVLSTVAMRLLYVAVRAREKAAQRQEILARSATEMLKASDATALSILAWQSQAELIGADDHVLAYLFIRQDGHYDLGGATSQPQGAQHVPGAVLDAVLDRSEREPYFLDRKVPELAEFAPHARHWVLIPSAGGETRVRILALASSSAVDKDLIISSQMLMRQTALAHSAMEHRDTLQWQAWHDGLTQLPNRRYFLDRLATACALPERAAQVALLFVDLDGFKAVNDNHGHLAGDEVLIVTAGRLARALREEDLVARLGGDEFAVLVYRDDDLRIASDLAGRLEQAICQPITLNSGVTVVVRASIGVHHGKPTLDADGLLHAADTAMYRLKAERRGVGPAAEAAAHTQT